MVFPRDYDSNGSCNIQQYPYQRYAAYPRAIERTDGTVTEGTQSYKATDEKSKRIIGKAFGGFKIKKFKAVPRFETICCYLCIVNMKFNLMINDYGSKKDVFHGLPFGWTNEEIASFLEMGWTDIFECRISRIKEDSHPEEQVWLTIKIKKNKVQ